MRRGKLLRHGGGLSRSSTAETYGITEGIFGEWLADKPRDSIILATKVAGAANGWFVPPVRHGLTAIDAFHITTAIEGSLRRLKTDYIDLYQVHWPDTVVPIEESLEALDQLVRSGKVRYIGTSKENSYGLTKALETSRYRGFKRFESIQNNFSMLNRRFLDEIAIVCQKEQVGLLPSPLAGGVLSGKYMPGGNWEGYRFGDYLNNPDPRMRAQAGRFAGERSVAAAQKYAAIAEIRPCPGNHGSRLDPQFRLRAQHNNRRYSSKPTGRNPRSRGNRPPGRASERVRHRQSGDSLSDGVKNG